MSDLNLQHPGRPDMLSHQAYVTHNVEATVEFYEKIMGMPLVDSVIGDKVPSTGDDFPYFHVFFRQGDGSTIAFFEAPGLPKANPKGHPAYDVFDHLALQVDTTARVDAWKEWLNANGISTVGPIDHGIIYSVYFRDPVNDLRLEITTPLDPTWNDNGAHAQQELLAWSDVKRKASEQNENIAEALMKFIQVYRNESHGNEPA